jgi:lipoyl(octanoyl) transferase
MQADQARTWFLANSGPGSAAFNMGLDEALLEATGRLGCPVLRFYGWREPAASFGYFQKYADVQKLTPLRPLVRRPTGGGLVPHDADWTYSLAFAPGSEWYLLAAVDSYRRVHEWIQEAFTKVGLETQLALTSAKSGPGQCFLGFERFDLLFQGRKIAGAAQRRRRDGLLIQGSVQGPSPSLTRADWEKAMCEVGRRQREIEWQALPVDACLVERAQELAGNKYGQASHNEKR